MERCCQQCCLDLDLALLGPGAGNSTGSDAFPRYDGCHLDASGYRAGPHHCIEQARLQGFSCFGSQYLPSLQLAHLSTQSSSLLLEPTPFCQANLGVLPIFSILPHPRSRPRQRIHLLSLLSKFFIPIPYGTRLRPSHRTQHVFKFIFQTATTTSSTTGSSPTQRKVFFIPPPPLCVLLFHHHPRKVILLELGHSLNLACTIRGKRRHRTQARGRLNVRSRRILVEERGERFGDGLTLGAFIASAFCVGHRRQFGGLVDTTAFGCLFVVFVVRRRVQGLVVVDQVLRVGSKGQRVFV